MYSKFIGTASFMLLVFPMGPANASAQNVQVYAGQPGPYEVHEFRHRQDSFDRQPYFSTHPPVYYSQQRTVRSYGWTPFPYLGSQYQEPLSAKPEAANGKQDSSMRRGNKDRQRRD